MVVPPPIPSARSEPELETAVTRAPLHNSALADPPTSIGAALADTLGQTAPQQSTAAEPAVAIPTPAAPAADDRALSARAKSEPIHSEHSSSSDGSFSSPAASSLVFDSVPRTSSDAARRLTPRVEAVSSDVSGAGSLPKVSVPEYDEVERVTASEAPEAEDPLVGTLVGERYRIERVLGTGGMGTVYLAEHVLMEKHVALKVLHPNLAVVSAVMDRFQKEAVALARIDHPNVVSASDFGKLKNGSFYLALQYIVGGSLADLLEGRGALDIKTALGITRQICRALGAAHSEGIVHRDLKPHNVMITGDDGLMVKVLDFGLAKLRSKTGEGAVTRAGSVFGTPHYMAPEQVTGQEVDERADLYALGILLYEMLAGHRPFDGDRVQQVLGSQVSDEAEPLPESMPIEVRQLVDKLMRKSRSERPASAAAVLRVLDPMLDAPAAASAPPVAETLSWPQRSTNLFGLTLPNWSLLLPIVTFAVMIIAGLLGSGGSDNEPNSDGNTLSSSGSKSDSKAKPSETAPAPERWPSLISAAEFGDEKAIEELLQIPPNKRDKELWLVLGQGLMKRKKATSAMKLYREAIHQIPELNNNERILKNVRLATTDSRSAATAVTVAAESMGSEGADVVFAVWAETKRRTRTTALAQRYLEEKLLLDKASKQLLLALALRKKDLSCEQTQKLVTDAREFGDTRSLRPLRKLRLRKGCGTARDEDCFPCLRENNLLENAISAATKRIGPAP